MTVLTIDETLDLLRRLRTEQAQAVERIDAAIAIMENSMDPDRPTVDVPPAVDAGQAMLEALADHDGVLVDDVSAIGAWTAATPGVLGSTVSTKSRELEAEGLVERRKPSLRRCTGVRLTDDGWRVLGKNRGPVPWPDERRPERALSVVPDPPLPRADEDKQTALVRRVASAWNSAGRVGPQAKLTAVRRATQLPEKRALELVRQARGFGLIGTLENMGGAS